MTMRDLIHELPREYEGDDFRLNENSLEYEDEYLPYADQLAIAKYWGRKRRGQEGLANG